MTTAWIVAFGAIMLIIIVLVVVFSRFVEIFDRLEEIDKRIVHSEDMGNNILRQLADVSNQGNLNAARVMSLSEKFNAEIAERYRMPVEKPVKKPKTARKKEVNWNGTVGTAENKNEP